MNTTTTNPNTVQISDDQQSADIQEILSSQSIIKDQFSIDELDVAKAYGFESVDAYRQHDFEEWMKFQEESNK